MKKIVYYLQMIKIEHTVFALPFALLGIFLFDLSFTFTDPLSILFALFSLYPVWLYYLFFVVVLELVLRLVYSLFHS